MTVVLASALVLSVCANALLVFLFLSYLAKRDERECRDRQLLLNRIQAPEVAVAQTIDARPTPQEQLFVPYDDDLAFYGFEAAS